MDAPAQTDATALSSTAVETSTAAPPSIVMALQSPTSVAGDADDATLHHTAVSDDLPSPAAAATSSSAAPKFTAAKASATSLASKIAFGGRKLLSPLTAAGGAAKDKAPPPPPPQPPHESPSQQQPPPASSTAASVYDSGSLKAGVKTGAKAALAGAAVVTDAASAVTSSISSFLWTNAPTTVPGAASGPPSTTSQQSTAIADPEESAEYLEQLDAEYRQVTAQQRMQILEDLVQHRRADWSYLKAMHEGTNYWLNIALLRERQVLAHLGERQSIRRSVQFFYLGLGLGRLISDVRHAQFMAMEACQLLEELEFYFSSATVQGMKLMVATNSSLHEPLHKMDDEALYSVQEPFRPTIYKWNQRPVFRRLLTPAIPFPLDYREVMLSLCDILALVYSKLVEDSICSENVYLFQAIIRFDEKIKKLVIDPVKKEFSAVAAQVVAEELVSVRRTFSSGGATSNREATSAPPTSTVISE